MADNLNLSFGLTLDPSEQRRTEEGLKRTEDAINSLGNVSKETSKKLSDVSKAHVEGIKETQAVYVKLAENYKQVASFTRRPGEDIEAQRRQAATSAGYGQQFAEQATQSRIETFRRLLSGQTGSAFDVNTELTGIYKNALVQFERQQNLAREEQRRQAGIAAAVEMSRKAEGVDPALQVTKGPLPIKESAESWDEAKKAAGEYYKQLVATNKKTVEIERSTDRASEVTRDSYDEINDKLLEYVKALDAIDERYEQQTSQVAELNRAASDIGQISAVLAAAGTAVVGGMALSARQYVQFVEAAGIQGDETADRWIAASKRVKNAQLNLGEASAQALLPIYEQAAELAEKAAAFVQQNPELVQAALNTGLVVATLGAVGAAVSKGIKIYADFKYLAATAEYSLATTRFQASVREYLAGVVLPGGGGAGGAVTGAGGGAAGKIIGGGISIAVGVVIAKAIVEAVSAGLAQTDFGKKIDEAQREAAAGGGGYPGINRYARETEKVDQAAEEAAQSASELSDGLRDFNQEAVQAQATNAFIQYRQQEKQAEENYMKQRAQVVEQGARQIAQIEANYATQRARLISQFAASSAQARDNFEYQRQQAEEQFAFSEAQAVRNYNEQRAEAQEEFQRDERRSREDHLSEMRKLAEDHHDRLRDLAIARDALGIIEENRDYDRRRQDAESEYRTDSHRRREDFQRQQQDREQEFAQERARRRQEFEFRQQQAQEDFERQQKLAREQFEERLEQLAEEHQAQLAQAKRDTAERLRQLQEQFREEQIHRRNAFYDILRDLDANLLNEQQIRANYYQRMQQDLLQFLEATSGAAGSNLPGYKETHQAGGYGPGYVGAGEFVASRSTTRMLEGLVGGRLTQQSLGQAVARGGGGMVLNDQRRFYGSISNEERRMIKEDTQELLENIHGII